MKKNGVWEVILRIFIAAATAALTALGTTSCMGQGPIGFQHEREARFARETGASDQVQAPCFSVKSVQKVKEGYNKKPPPLHSGRGMKITKFL